MENKIKIPAWVALEADILICDKLNNTEKVLYAFISALSNNEDKQCIAHNKYFSIVLGISEREVQYCLSKLKELNLIRIDLKDNSKRTITTTVNAFLEYRKEKIKSLKEVNKNILEFDWLNEN